MTLFAKSIKPHLNLPHVPHKHSKLLKIIGAVLPLIVIALGVYLFYNFPAIKDKVQYGISKPKVGDSHLLPKTLRSRTNNQVAVSTDCSKPIPYDKNGNPKAICDNYIYIPKIHVAAPFYTPPSTRDDVINEYLLKGVLHYPGTADPGQKGNVFLTGHSSYYWWAKSDYKFVFTLEPQLTYNDEIYVYHKGIRYTYKVTELREVTPQTTDVLRPTTEPTLTLSTCVPIGTSYHRKIVRAKQITPDPAGARPAAAVGPDTSHLPGNR